MLQQTDPFYERIARWRQRVLDTIHQVRQSDQIEAAASARPSEDSTLLAVSGWRSLRVGDRQLAQTCFRTALHYDPYSISAWLGLSRTAESPELRRACLQAAFDLHYLLHDALEASAEEHI